MFYGYKLENKKNSYIFIYKNNVYKTKTALKKELQKHKITPEVITVIMEYIIYVDKKTMISKLSDIGLMKSDVDKIIVGDKT